MFTFGSPCPRSANLIPGFICPLYCRLGSLLDAMKRIVGTPNPEGRAEEGTQGSMPTPDQPLQKPKTPDSPGTMGGKRSFLPPEMMSIVTPSLQVGAGAGMSCLFRIRDRPDADFIQAPRDCLQEPYMALPNQGPPSCSPWSLVCSGLHWLVATRARHELPS